MAVSLKVMTNVEGKLRDRFTDEEMCSLTPEQWMDQYGDVLREIYEEVFRDIQSEAGPDGQLNGAAEYIKDYPMDFDEAQESEGYGFGALKPDEIREAALSWNRVVSMDLIRNLKAFEDEAEKQGFKRVTDMFAANMAEDGRIRWDNFPYPAALYPLRKAMDAAENTFTYGQNYLYYDTTEWMGMHPCMPAGEVELAKDHPEYFLVMDVYYD